jgi:hypothetical protein
MAPEVLSPQLMVMLLFSLFCASLVLFSRDRHVFSNPQGPVSTTMNARENAFHGPVDLTINCLLGLSEAPFRRCFPSRLKRPRPIRNTTLILFGLLPQFSI